MRKAIWLACLLLSVWAGRAQDAVEDAVHFVEQMENINSLDQLLAPYQGKVVYIDLWATWCGPCRKQFDYKDELVDFVGDQPIQLLYVSTDKASAEARWRTMVTQRQIKGHHLRANDALREELFDRFYDRIVKGRKSLSIPRYLIVNSKGKVVQADARRPSAGKKLYKQLARYLP